MKRLDDLTGEVQGVKKELKRVNTTQNAHSDLLGALVHMATVETIAPRGDPTRRRSSVAQP